METGKADVSVLSVFTYGTLKPGGRYHRRYCDGYRMTVEQVRSQNGIYLPSGDWPIREGGL